MISLKEGNTGLKKRLKRQEDDILNHKNELKKLTATAEDKLGEYAKEDEHKQGKNIVNIATIKKQSTQIDRLRSDLNKKEKSIKSKNEKLEELKNSELNCEKMIKLA